jgi:hypothetical protein
VQKNHLKYGPAQKLFSKELTSFYSAKVVRAGKRHTVGVSEIVFGDLIVLNQGDRVPALIRLVKVAGCKVDEFLITGKAGIVQKNTLKSPDHSDRTSQTCMLFEGSIVNAGSALGIVVQDEDDVLQPKKKKRKLFPRKKSILVKQKTHSKYAINGLIVDAHLSESEALGIADIVAGKGMSVLFISSPDQESVFERLQIPKFTAGEEISYSSLRDSEGIQNVIKRYKGGKKILYLNKGGDEEVLFRYSDISVVSRSASCDALTTQAHYLTKKEPIDVLKTSLNLLTK